MRTIILCLAALISINCSSFADFLFKGKIIAYDGSAPAMANVSYKDLNDSTCIEQTDKDGNYSINVKNDITVELLFTAVNHFSLTQKFPITSGNDFLQVDIKLKPFTKSANIKDVTIRGSFNDFSNFPSEKMVKNDDSTFTFKVKYKSDTLLYQICPEYYDKAGNHIFNGTQSDFYVYNKNSDYKSGIIKKDREFNIFFNPNLFPEGEFKTELIFHNEKYSKDFNNYQQISDDFDKCVSDILKINNDKNISKVQKQDKLLEAKIIFLKDIEKQIKDINIIEFRNLSIMKYLEVAYYGNNVEGIEDNINKNLLKEIYTIPPDSKLWNGSASNYYSLAYAEIFLGKINNAEYLNKVLNLNKIDKNQTHTLAFLVQYFYNNKLIELKDKYSEILQKQYPDSKDAQKSKYQYGKDKVIQIGKNIPEFSYKNLDNEAEEITPKTLEGKYVLIDFWGTWCGHCIDEIPNLFKAFNKFKDKNFTIYSIAIDASANTINIYRKYHKMPWIHSYAGNWESGILEKFEIVGVPRPILIDPQGKIIAVDGLRGDKLIETLVELIK